MYIGDKGLAQESEGEENNREVKNDPLDSSSPEGRVKGEGENRGCEESVVEENNRDKRDTDESIEKKGLPYCFPPLPTPHLRTHTPDSHLQI
jgi:hypothetical protein